MIVILIYIVAPEHIKYATDSYLSEAGLRGASGRLPTHFRDGVTNFEVGPGEGGGGKLEVFC